jgi:hypothetical protein
MDLAQRAKWFALVDCRIDDGNIEPLIKPVARRVGAVQRQ